MPPPSSGWTKRDSPSMSAVVELRVGDFPIAAQPRTAMSGRRPPALVRCAHISMPRVLTFNVLTMRDASGERRHVVARELVRAANADVVALQEVTRRPDCDQAADLVGPGYTILDVPGGDPTYGGECLASRLPVERSWAMDVPIAEHAGRTIRAAALAAEVIAP